MGAKPTLSRTCDGCVAECPHEQTKREDGVERCYACLGGRQLTLREPEPWVYWYLTVPPVRCRRHRTQTGAPAKARSR